MDTNVFSLFSLNKTKLAIAELQNLLLCGICNRKASDPICLGTCDHFFCATCLKTQKDSACPICQIPSTPLARNKDNVVASLLSSSEDLLNIFNGVKVNVNIQGIEAPWSTDITMPYCSKTPIRPLKLKVANKENIKTDPIKKVMTKSKHDVNNKIGLLKKVLDSNEGPSTPKHQSIMKPQQELTPLINKRNAKGETSLHSWCIKGNFEKVKTLLEDGANPNTRDNAGWTPLHEASSNGYLEIAELLLQKGALVNVPGNNNETALHDSVSSSCLSMICLLRKWGANPNLKDIWGKTPLDLSAMNYSQDVSEALETLENPELVAIPKQLPMQTKIVIMESNLSAEYKKKLLQVSKICKVRLVREFCTEVTHVVVMCDENYHCPRTLKYMTGVVAGKTIISNKWINASIASEGMANFHDFEVIGTTVSPNSKAPEKGRKNTLQMNPNLFNGCHIFFHGVTNESSPSRKELEILIKAGDGIHLQREPNPEAIEAERKVPFHYSSNGRLSKCSHFCLYKDGEHEPLMKYDMPHLKSLPLSWLFNCVERFEIID